MPGPLRIRLPKPVAAVRVAAGPAAGGAAGPVQSGPGIGQELPPATGPAAAPAQGSAELEAERSQLRQARQALMQAASRLGELQQDLFQQAETQLVSLALDIARKILMREIEAGRYDIEPIVKEALMRVPARHDVVVHLHPDDWSRCQMAQQSQDGGEAGRVRFVSDPTVRRAECVIEGPEGIVESAVENQLQETGEALRAVE